MAKLNWEKQNKVEQPKAKRKRLDREKVTKAYSNGAKNERQRIMQIIEKRKAYDCTCSCDCHSHTSPCTACQADNELIEIIKGENK